VVSSLEETIYSLKCRIEKKEEEVLRAYKQVQELEEKLEESDHYIQEARRKPSLPLRNCLNIQELENPGEALKKYGAKNSSYLMRATPDQSGCDFDNNNSCICGLMQPT
jgi:molybdopterin converting factor small subunit